jgi:uncharacterized protein (TIGR02569 family)
VSPPPPSVWDAWGVERPVRLSGGQGYAFVTRELVLKPVLDAREAEWLAGVLAALPDMDDLRIIRPVAARSGEWVVDGWAAWERLDGVVRNGAWREVLEVSQRFHAAVATVARSDAIGRDHPWAIGDRYAWHEQDLELPPHFRDVVDRLENAWRDIALPEQLMHGDLLHNVLSDDHLPPAVIDVSPYWRPARYADAIVIADAIGWSGAPVEAIDPLSDPEGIQLLIRATLFRLASAVVLCEDDAPRLNAELAAYEQIASALFR